MAESLLTPELEAKLERFARRIADHAEVAALGVIDLLQDAKDLGIGLVDADRQRSLVDERVYESALHRGRVGRRYLSPRQPEPAVWRSLLPEAS